MHTWDEMTIVTSCHGYGKYLKPWAESIVALTTRPGAVCIFTHGLDSDFVQAQAAVRLLRHAGINVSAEHVPRRLDFGTARNKAVEMSKTEWVMHLDCDDRIMPHGLDDARALAPDADVISFGYERAGDNDQRPKNPTKLYKSGDGLEVLNHLAPCSGVSPFRRKLWERSPYRTDMQGAWDTALWIGFCRLGARFRATRRPCFWYWHHLDAIYTQRRLTYNWKHAYTAAQLGSLRRNDRGVAVIIPRDKYPTELREEAYNTVLDHFALHHADWQVYEGFSDPRRWKKGEAVAQALTRCPNAEIIVITDADVIVHPDALRHAVRKVSSGAPWFIPHKHVYRLNATATIDYQNLVTSGKELPLPTEEQLARKPYLGYPGGGIVVIKRFCYEATGGIPDAFEGWGGEDTALAVVLDTLIGHHGRGDAPLFHFWHEPQSTKQQSAPNIRRYRRLKDAATRGVDSLWAQLRALPRGPQPPRRIPPWKRNAIERELQTHGVNLEARQQYLARRRAGGE